MPSTTKTKRREADFYETPEWCTRLLLDTFKLAPIKVVEPCAGHGAISRVIKEYFPKCTLVQYELHKNKKLQKYGDVTFGDFLKNVRYDEDVSMVITNPPFTYSQEFIETCRTNYPNAKIIMLLPFSFLGSAKRWRFWVLNKPNKFHVLSNRPSFTENGKTDSSVYAWYQWDSENLPQEFHPPEFLIKGGE